MNPDDWPMAQEEAGGGRDPIWAPSLADKEERSPVAAHQRCSFCTAHIVSDVFDIWSLSRHSASTYFHVSSTSFLLCFL